VLPSLFNVLFFYLELDLVKYGTVWFVGKILLKNVSPTGVYEKSN
jgi:hypothetical protein